MRKKLTVSLLLLLTCAVGFGCQKPAGEMKEQDLQRVRSLQGGQTKKVIMILVDSLMPKTIDTGIRQKRLPTFQYLTEHGQYYRNMVSSFPTMSVTIDSSLQTGEYPDKHRVPGLTWYSAAERRVINYGTGPMEVLRQGPGTVLEDALISLNGKHLSRHTPTVYEELARRGLTSGSVNGLIYRGASGHELILPAWLHAPSHLPSRIPVKGPDLLALGSLANPLAERIDLPDGAADRFGLNNRFSAETAAYLIRAGKLPDYLFVYLPDLDQELHRKGPGAMEEVERVDGQLATVLQAFGSREEALRKAIIIVAGDSGMTPIMRAEKKPTVELGAIFKDDRLLRPGEPVSARTGLIAAVNETMAYVYRMNTDKTLRALAGELAADSRIDLAAWKERGWIYVLQGKTKKELRFKPGGKLADPYGQKWTAERSLDVLDVKADSRTGRIAYDRYPDGFRRLSAALSSHDGDYLIVTAKPGYELADRSSPKHNGGGGHGALGREETLVPLLIAGTRQKPEHLRMIDIKPFVLRLLTERQDQHPDGK
ncbi:alkaline phosphatase family protein [Paenibacillus humicola]|uniref:alkaline phosphatase family protein n=1 Tax=Paenibacillus humicola TaxID=3110540 RepID=UPI00237C4697|nr:alkaline phosphatase family protein [Paenibacillus humicola]